MISKKYFSDKTWVDRLTEEYLALIKYVEINKEADNDWFKIESNKEGTKFNYNIFLSKALIVY